MNRYLLLLLILLIFASPAFAGKLNVTGTNFGSAYANTGDVVPVLNLSLGMTDEGTMNITILNVTFNGTITAGNITDVRVYINSTSGALVGSNSTFNLTGNFTTITFTTPIKISHSNITSFFITINLSSSATPRSLFNITIASVNDIGVSAGNTSNALESTSSIDMQIQDVHATGDITPNYVDTSVINQSALLILNVTGSDNFDNISIVLPSSYKIVNVTEVSNKTNIIYNNTLGAVYFNVTFGGYTLNISNFTQGFNATDSFLKINFTINTSSTAVSSTRIRVNMTGSNLTNVNATETGTNSLNITTQQMINITTVTVTKSTAIVNGTDYWEFNITVNITANTSGILQFRMNNWNSTTQGYGLLNLTNETGAFVENVTYRAMLRNQSAQTGSQQLNVTTDYGNLTRGLSLDYTGITKTLILKMTIPTGMPYTSDWWSTYYILFRSST